MKKAWQIREEILKRAKNIKMREESNYGSYRANLNFTRALLWVLGKEPKLNTSDSILKVVWEMENGTGKTRHN